MAASLEGCRKTPEHDTGMKLELPMVLDEKLLDREGWQHGLTNSEGPKGSDIRTRV